MLPKPKKGEHREKSLHWKIRDQVWAMDQNCCRFCGSISIDPPHHIIYRSQGGKDTPENLITLCITCHHRCHHGHKDRRGIRDTAREYMFRNLDFLRRANKEFRWWDAYDRLKVLVVNRRTRDKE